MLEPFLELMLDATDTALTVIVLLALWEGRTARGRFTLAHWLRKTERGSDLETFSATRAGWEAKAAARSTAPRRDRRPHGAAAR